LNEPEPRHTLWDTIKSVGAAFFGVQSSANRERDFKHGKASHFIAVGLAATVVFVLVLILAVRFALRQAAM
jgi:Protein of unknown function (DUF2970)